MVLDLKQVFYQVIHKITNVTKIISWVYKKGDNDKKYNNGLVI